MPRTPGRSHLMSTASQTTYATAAACTRWIACTSMPVRAGTSGGCAGPGRLFTAPRAPAVSAQEAASELPQGRARRGPGLKAGSKVVEPHPRRHRQRLRGAGPAVSRASRHPNEHPGGSSCRAPDRKAVQSLLVDDKGAWRRTVAHALPGRKARHCRRRASPAARHARRRRLPLAIYLRLGIGARLPVRAGLPVRVARHGAWRPSRRSRFRCGF